VQRRSRESAVAEKDAGRARAAWLVSVEYWRAAAGDDELREGSAGSTLLQSFPEMFSVPKRFAKHMMIVADLQNGNADAIEDAVIAAWELQSGR
jgi:hypothetical protein